MYSYFFAGSMANAFMISSMRHLSFAPVQKSNREFAPYQPHTSTVPGPNLLRTKSVLGPYQLRICSVYICTEMARRWYGDGTVKKRGWNRGSRENVALQNGGSDFAVPTRRLTILHFAPDSLPAFRETKARAHDSFPNRARWSYPSHWYIFEWSLHFCAPTVSARS